jgi:DICT domain-containing protein
MKYRKKPVVIEAFQMTRANRESNEHWPNWAHEAWQSSVLRAVNDPQYAALVQIATLEGIMDVMENDWIICGIKGELYPCKPDIFQATYEQVEEPN